MCRRFMNYSTLIVILALAVSSVAATWLHGRPGAASGSAAARTQIQAVPPHTAGPLGRMHGALSGDAVPEQHPGHTGALWDERLWLIAFAGIALVISLIVCGDACRVFRRRERSPKRSPAK